MNVALLSPCFWPEVRRGTERFARLLADGLIARGHAVTLITSHPGPTSRTVEDGLRIVRLRRPPGGARLSRRMWEDHLLHVPRSYLELRRGDYDVAHALYPTDALAAARWSAETGRPAVHSFMGIPHRQGLANRRGRVEIVRRAIAGTRATVALSEAARDGFARWLGVDARVINPGVDLQAFTPDEADRAPAPTIFTAAAIGEPRKRVDLLLRAFALLRERRPDAQLVLARAKGAWPLWRHGVKEKGVRPGRVGHFPSTRRSSRRTSLRRSRCGPRSRRRCPTSSTTSPRRRSCPTRGTTRPRPCRRSPAGPRR
jgi:glycosyltransferase involved in cell wall biosynthesis